MRQTQGVKVTSEPRFSPPLVVLVSLLFGSPAFAHCDISNYDRTPPARISGKVDNATVQFVWATDVDTSDGRNWIWHYITNNHDRGLGYRWPKAELRRALGSPLEPGQTDCNRYFVLGAASPDDNAPITYGTNDTPQRAAVFADRTTAKAKSTSSVIETSYRGPSGVVENVRVAVSTVEGKTTQDRWQLLIEQTPNVTVALSAPEGISQEQFRSLDAQMKVEEIKLGSGALAGLYTEDEATSRLSHPYIIFKSKPKKAVALVPAAVLRQISSDLVLLDGEARPFFATAVRLLAPDNFAK